MISIDGSVGEGGGQILRTSLALSAALGMPFTITNIRKGREKPGLMRQHLTAVQAAQRICDARVSGAAVGSTQLAFEPGALHGGDFTFSIGTAGSTTMVMQAVLPALMVAPQPSRITVEGGTHQTHAPPFEFFAKALVPLMNRMGPRITARLERHGFYPAGGGRIVIDVNPVTSLAPLHLPHPGERGTPRLTVLLAKLHMNIGLRERERVMEKLTIDAPLHCIEYIDASHSAGNVVLVEVPGQHVTEVFSALGEVGRPAESVCDQVVREVRQYVSADVAVGTYLADQLMAPMAIAAARGGHAGGAFTTLPLSMHAHTNLGTIATMTGLRAAATGEGVVTVTIGS